MGTDQWVSGRRRSGKHAEANRLRLTVSAELVAAARPRNPDEDCSPFSNRPKSILMVKKNCMKTLPLASFACALVLSGCSKAAKNRHSQIVAKVNDQEITVLQLNQALH